MCSNKRCMIKTFLCNFIFQFFVNEMEPFSWEWTIKSYLPILEISVWKVWAGFMGGGFVKEIEGYEVWGGTPENPLSMGPQRPRYATGHWLTITSWRFSTHSWPYQLDICNFKTPPLFVTWTSGCVAFQITVTWRCLWCHQPIRSWSGDIAVG